ncbi:MAG TPA: hypothetical protein VII75_11290 [Thermoanaerobaculia bacterium]
MTPVVPARRGRSTSFEMTRAVLMAKELDRFTVTLSSHSCGGSVRSRRRWPHFVIIAAAVHVALSIVICSGGSVPFRM